ILHAADETRVPPAAGARPARPAFLAQEVGQSAARPARLAADRRFRLVAPFVGPRAAVEIAAHVGFTTRRPGGRRVDAEFRPAYRLPPRKRWGSRWRSSSPPPPPPVPAGGCSWDSGS